jgi:hypothetical protein
MKHPVAAILVFLTVGLCAQAQAQTPTAQGKSVIPDLGEASRKGDMARLAQQKTEDRFNAADEDNDGQLSRVEAAKHLPFYEANFERYDKNKDGFLSWNEFVGHDKWKHPSKAN